MAKIVAGRFREVGAAQAAVSALPGEGFERAQFQSFFVTPPGQHATFPVGGDAYSDEGAKEAGGGALRGVLIGGAIGLVAGMAAYLVFNQLITILAGIGLGAYVGSLLGALVKTRAGNALRATVEHPVERASGPMVAIRVDDTASESRAVAILERHGAYDIERTEGQWHAGDWKDFDPRRPAPPERGVPTESVVKKVTAEGQQAR
jgi:hypothetical protein